MPVTPVDHRGHVAAPPQPRPSYNLHRDATARRYLDGMLKSGELLPGSVEPILKRLDGLVKGAPAPGGNVPALDRFAKLDAFLASDAGAAFKNPEHVAEVPEAPLRAVLRRLAVPPKAAARLYDDLAVATAGRTGLTLLSPVWAALDVDGLRHHLGTVATDPVPPGASRPPKPVGL
jgi:hypothetical protein